jgi:serine/threonine-protein kinase
VVDKEPQPGSYVGKYRVIQPLGAGAMGEVILALDEGLHRKVALKILSSPAANAEMRERFVREARAVANLNHPNIVQVFSIDVWDDRPFYAMEYLPGRDLGAVIRHRKRIPQDEAVRMILDAARGLREAARAGIIHRDVKPSNLVLTDRNDVKVTDFGLAKKMGKEASLTEAGMVLGTPDYIAPEQARGEELEPRTDVYALGCTLFHLCAGRPPFRNPGDDEDKYLKVITRHITEPVPDLTAEVPGISLDVARLCRRMMSKRPQDRPGYDDLIPVLESIALRQGRAPGVGGHVSVSINTVTGIERPRARLHRVAIGATIVSAILFLTSIGLTLYQVARNAKAAERAALGELQRKSQPPPAPPGYILVTPADGTSAYVAVQVVTNAEFAHIMGNDFSYDPDKADQPVTGISYLDAADYAMRVGARIPADDEWQAAESHADFIPPPDNLCEWVWDDQHDHDDRFARCKFGTRRDLPKGSPEPDVSFRVCLDRPVVEAAQ